MLPPSGAFVAYAGRAGRVRGVEPVNVAGATLEALVIVLTASPRGIFQVPLHRVDKHVKRISEAQAAAMDQALADPNVSWGRPATAVAQQRRIAAHRQKFAELGRMGGLIKLANKRRKEKAAQTENGRAADAVLSNQTVRKVKLCLPMS